MSVVSAPILNGNFLAGITHGPMGERDGKRVMVIRDGSTNTSLPRLHVPADFY